MLLRFIRFPALDNYSYTSILGRYLAIDYLYSPVLVITITLMLDSCRATGPSPTPTHTLQVNKLNFLYFSIAIVLVQHCLTRSHAMTGVIIY